jgi:hypothetical protein
MSHWFILNHQRSDDCGGPLEPAGFALLASLAIGAPSRSFLSHYVKLP